MLGSGSEHTPTRRDAPLGRDEAVWMIQVVRWIPADFPNSGATALMHSRVSEAVASFSLQEAVREVDALRLTEAPPPVGAGPRVDPTEGIETEAGVDPRANPAEAGIEEVEVRSHSSTEQFESEPEAPEMGAAELPESASGCAFFALSPADPPSADRCGEAPLRGPPSTDLKGSRRIRGEGLDLALGCSPPLS